MKEIHQKLDKRSRKHTEKEVKAVDDRLHAGQKLTEKIHKPVCRNIRNDNERDLNGKFS